MIKKKDYKENKIAKMVCRIFESCPPVKVIRDGVSRTVVGLPGALPTP